VEQIEAQIRKSPTKSGPKHRGSRSSILLSQCILSESLLPDPLSSSFSRCPSQSLMHVWSVFESEGEKVVAVGEGVEVRVLVCR
jgi:hypothetical protein